MAKAWQYPRWRYYLMQAVMWGVLAAMVGAAGLVDHQRRKSLEVKLGKPQTKRNLTIQLPEGWTSKKSDADSPILFQLQDPVLRRTLQVIRELHPEFVSPAQYLARSFGKTTELKIEPLMIAGTLGSIARATLSFSDDQEGSGDAVEVQIVAAATVLPSGHAISVQIVGAATPSQLDEDLVKRIAATIEAHGEPKLSDEGLHLRGGTTIDVPDGWVGITPEDPNRSSREIRMQSVGANLWRGVTLVPVTLLPNDDPSDIATLCSAWDTDWRLSQTKLLGPRRWRVERANEAWSDYAVSQIYVMGDPQGHGLMAIFEGSGSDDSWIEPMWKALGDGTKFPQSSDLQPRLDAGAKIVSQIKEHGLNNFLGDVRPERWWLYCYVSPDHPIGWLHEEPVPGVWRQSNESRFTFPERGNSSVLNQWEGNEKLNDYACSVQRKLFEPHGDETSHLRLSATIRNGKIELSASGTDVESKESIDPSPIYLPGGWAGLLVGKLPEKPMILETDTFPGYEGAATSSLMQLIITPSSDVAHSGQPDAKPLRCMDVEVNGSGEISRWFFKSDGSLDSIDYADGFRRMKSDLPSIRNSFTNPFMKP